MKKSAAAALLVLLVVGMHQPAKDKLKYFRMDKVIDVTGIIEKISTEERYEKSRFIVFELKERKTGKLYDVEISPLWFYQLDVAEGTLISVKGSLNNMEDKDVILAQSMTFSGEIFTFRDEFGFPLWRGKNRRGGQGKWSGEGKKKGRN